MLRQFVFISVIFRRIFRRCADIVQAVLIIPWGQSSGLASFGAHGLEVIAFCAAILFQRADGTRSQSNLTCLVDIKFRSRTRCPLPSVTHWNMAVFWRSVRNGMAEGTDKGQLRIQNTIAVFCFVCPCP